MTISFNRPIETGKKIKRSYFKKETILLSCDCIFSTNRNFQIQAKLYVSAIALNLVHLPKRRKLESIPFATIKGIQRSPVQSQLIVFTDNENIYTLDICGPSSTLDFVMSCWNTANTDKVALTGSQQGRANGSFTSSFSSVPSANTSLSGLFVNLDNKLSANGAEKKDTLVPVGQAESVDRDNVAEWSTSAPEFTSTSLPVAFSFTSQVSTGSEVEGSAPSTATVPPTDHLSSPHKVDSYQFRQAEAAAVIQPELRTRARPKRQSAGPIAAAAVEEVDCKPTGQRHQSPTLPPSPLATTTTLGLNPHTAVGRGSPSFFFWPVNWLLYFLVSLTAQRHQRFTMLIAYVILAFLMCSTLHLYHRLAMFHLGSGSSIVLSPGGVGSTTAPTESIPTEQQPLPGSEDVLQQLEQATLQLAELVSQMNQLMSQMLREVQRAGVPSEAVKQEPVVV